MISYIVMTEVMTISRSCSYFKTVTIKSKLSTKDKVQKKKFVADDRYKIENSKKIVSRDIA